MHTVSVAFAHEAIPKSPFAVQVQGYAADASKVTASGPGLQPTGNQAGAATHFDVFTKASGGVAQLDVQLVDPSGARDSTPATIKDAGDGTFRVEYTPRLVGTYSVNVFFGSKPIANSPYAVKVAAPCDPKKVGFPG